MTWFFCRLDLKVAVAWSMKVTYDPPRAIFVIISVTWHFKHILRQVSGIKYLNQMSTYHLACGDIEISGLKNSNTYDFLVLVLNLDHDASKHDRPARIFLQRK